MPGPGTEHKFESAEGVEYPHCVWCGIKQRNADGIDCPKNPNRKQEIGLDGLNRYSAECHEANKRWWTNIDTGESLRRNKGEQLMLIVSEVAEAMEGERKDLMDDKLPHRKMAEVELADALIRIFDYAGGWGMDLEGAYREKMAYNAKREDHKLEARKASGGKKF